MADEQDIQQPEQDGTPKLGVKEFAAKIKAKYPDYAGIDDNTLVQKIVTKYPQYKDQIDFGQKKNSLPTSQPSSTDATPSQSQSSSVAQSTSQENSQQPQTVQPQTKPQQPQPFDPATFMRQSRANVLQQPVQDNTAAVQPSRNLSSTESQLNKVAYQQRKAEINKEAVVNSTAQYLKNKGINAPVGSVQFNQQLAKTQDLVNSGQATVAINPDGQIGLKRVTGFLENIKNGWDEATKSADEADDFTNNMTTQQRVDYVKSHDIPQPDQFIGEQPSTFGSLGHFMGGAAPFLGKAAVGAGIGALAIAGAPESMGASLTGLPTAMSFILTAPDMANQGAQQEIIRRYQILKNQNPDMSDADAMEEAGKGALAGGIGGILTNAALMGTGLKTPLSLEAKGVVGKTLQEVVKSGVHMGGVSAGVTAAQEFEGEAEGIHTSLSDKMKDIAKGFVENATTGMMLSGMFHAVPKIVQSAFKYSLKDTPPDQIRNVLQANENAGTVPEGTTDKVMKDISSYNDALNKTVDGLTPEATASVAGLIQKKNSLIEESKTKDDSFKPVYKEKIDAIDQQIQDIQRTGKPFEHEIDEVTGKPYQQPTYDDVAQQNVKDLADKIAKGKQVTDPQDLQTQSNFPKELETELQNRLKEDQQAGKENSGVQQNINSFLKDKQPTIQSAVITINGKTYEGKNHAEAILKAKEDGQDISQVDRKGQGMFKLSDGTIISRDEAKQRFGQDRAELLIPQDEAAKQADKEYRKATKPAPVRAADKPAEPVSSPVISDKGVAEKSPLKNIESFETSKGSVYKVLPDGRTQRFKTKTGELKEPQDLTSFVKFEGQDEDNYLQAIHGYNGESVHLVGLVDGKVTELKTNEEAKNATNHKLVILDKDGKIVDKIDALLSPKEGYNVFDQRQIDKKGNGTFEKHIGNTVSKITEKTPTEQKFSEPTNKVENNSTNKQEAVPSTTDLEGFGGRGGRNRLYDRVKNLDEPTDIDGKILHYFAGGGKVHPESFSKEVVGMKRKGYGDKEGSYPSEVKGNTLVKATDENGKPNPTIKQLAESWGDGTNDHEIRNKIIDVLQSHGSRESAATELINRYDQEYIEAKHQKEENDYWEGIHKQEVEAEQNYLTEKGSEQDEIEQSPEYIKRLIKQYETETVPANDKPSDTGSKTESGEARSTPKDVEPEGVDKSERPSELRGSSEDKPEPDKGKRETSKGKIGDPLRHFADIVEKGKISKLGGFKSSTGFDAVWDGSLTVVAETLRKTADLADAIQAGLQHIKNSDWYKGLTDKKDFDEKYVAHLEGEYGKFEKEQPVDPAHPDYKPIGETTGIKKSIVNSEREARGKSALNTAKGIPDEQVFEQTKEKIESGEIPIEHIRDLTHALATDDADFLTNLSQTEIQNALLYDKETLRQEWKDLDAKYLKATQKGDRETIEDLLVKRAQNELLRDDNELASSKTGSELSSAFRARKHEIGDGYTLSELTRRYKDLNDDKISPDVIDKFREYERILNEKDAQLLEKNEAIAAADREIADLKELNKAAKEKSGHRKGEVSAFDDLKKETKNQIRQQGRRTIEKIKHDRESIKANLKAKWKNHQSNLGMNNIIPLDMVPDLIKLAKSYIEEGLAVGKEAVLEHIIDRVHKDVVEAIGDVDKTTVRDAITGYGKIKKPNTDPIDTAFRDIAAQGRLVSSIELAEKGEPPLKSGQQRDKPTAEQRRLQKELNKAIKDNNIQVKSPEEQLKTSLDAAKTRLKNQIEDLSDAIDRNEKIVKDRKGIEYDQEAKDLKAQRDELRDEYDKIFGTDKELTTEEQIERASNAVKKSIDKLNERIANKDFSQNKRVDLKSPELDALKKQREDLQKVYKGLMDAEGETNRRKLEALKKHIAKRTAYLNEIKNTGNLDKFIKDRERVKTVLDEEAKRMKAAQQKVKNDVENMLYQREFKNLNALQRGQYWFGRFSKGVLISNPAVLARIAGSVVFRGIYKAPTALSTLIWTKMAPESVTMKSVTESFHSVKDFKSHVGTYYTVLFSRENFKEMVDAFKQHNTNSDLLYDKYHKNIPIPEIKSKSPLLLPQKGFFKVMQLLDKNASLHGAGKSLAALPEQRAYEVTIASNFIRSGITPESVGSPVFKEMVNQLAYLKSRRAKFMQDNYVAGAQRDIERGLRQKGLHGTAEVVNMIAPITTIASNYISEAMTKIPGFGLLAAHKPIEQITANFLRKVGDMAIGEKASEQMFGKKTELTEKDASILMRTLAYQGVGAMSYAIGWMLSPYIAPFFKSPVNKYAKKQNGDEEDTWFGRLWETLSHSPDAVVMQAGATHHYFWQKYDEENPDKDISMSEFMDKVMYPILSNEQMVASSSPYLSSGQSVIAPLVTGLNWRKAAANFITSRTPFYTTSKEIAEGKIPFFNKLGVVSKNEETVKPYEVGIYPETFLDNIGIGVPGWRDKIIQRLYDEKYETRKPKETNEEKHDAKVRAHEKKVKLKEFKEQMDE